MSAETESQALAAVLGLHRMMTHTQCGARSIPLVHHHGAENDKNPGPLRVLRCSEPVGHVGLHKDAVCCYSFQVFADWQVQDRSPVVSDHCVCGSTWPCMTIRAIQEAW